MAMADEAVPWCSAVPGRCRVDWARQEFREKMNHDRFGFSETEWELLKTGPVHMLAHVAGADSHVDRDEWSALVAAVLSSVDHQDPLVQALMEDLSDELDGGPALDGESGLDRLRQIGGLLDRREDKGLQLRFTLLQLGATIAESSGAQLTRTFATNSGNPAWARSAGTSAMEREALRTAAEALGVE
jgi:hypothetical protein